MNKEEFLRELRGKITGKIPQDDVEQQINYYASYIDDEVSHGRDLNEVLDELGDPQLIAKTLYEASDGGYLDSSGITASQNPNSQTSNAGTRHESGQYEGGYAKHSGTSYERYAGHTQNAQKEAKKAAFKAKTWLILIFAAVIVIAALLIFFVVRVGVFLFTNLIPFIIVALIIVVLLIFLRRR